MIAREIIVKGKVQGVFYRAWAKEKADELGLYGWVKNCTDGSVELWVEGAEARVLVMSDWCWQGPARARVDRVDVKAVDPAGYLDFKVIR